MLRRLIDSLRRALAGRQLNRAVTRNAQAADDLDSLLREVLRR